MGIWVYKWLWLSWMAAAAGKELPSPAHPFHVSVTEINHNAAEKSLEITVKLFTDDFEAALSKAYKVQADLIRPANRAAMDSLVKRYLASHLSIRCDNRPVTLQYLGFEQDRESVYAYFEGGVAEAPRSVQVTSSVLYEQFEDQINILHISVNQARKSTRLNYPDREAEIRF